MAPVGVVLQQTKEGLIVLLAGGETLDLPHLLLWPPVFVKTFDCITGRAGDLASVHARDLPEGPGPGVPQPAGHQKDGEDARPNGDFFLHKKPSFRFSVHLSAPEAREAIRSTTEA